MYLRIDIMFGAHRDADGDDGGYDPNQHIVKHLTDAMRTFCKDMAGLGREKLNHSSCETTREIFFAPPDLTC